MSRTKFRNNLYNKQKDRTTCINCLSKLNIEEPDFKNTGVSYKICEICGHVNGVKKLSEEFTDGIYKVNSGKNYSANYFKDYESRLNSIYIPKAEFLKNSISNLTNINEFKVTDYGCGGVHFVNSLNHINIEAKGYDISETLIDLGSKFWQKINQSGSKPPFFLVGSESELLEKAYN